MPTIIKLILAMFVAVALAGGVGIVGAQDSTTEQTHQLTIYGNEVVDGQTIPLDEPYYFKVNIQDVNSDTQYTLRGTDGDQTESKITKELPAGEYQISATYSDATTQDASFDYSEIETTRVIDSDTTLEFRWTNPQEGDNGLTTAEGSVYDDAPLGFVVQDANSAFESFIFAAVFFSFLSTILGILAWRANRGLSAADSFFLSWLR